MLPCPQGEEEEEATLQLGSASQGNSSSSRWAPPTPKLVLCGEFCCPAQLSRACALPPPTGRWSHDGGGTDYWEVWKKNWGGRATRLLAALPLCLGCYLSPGIIPDDLTSWVTACFSCYHILRQHGSLTAVSLMDITSSFKNCSTLGHHQMDKHRVIAIIYLENKYLLF